MQTNNHAAFPWSIQPHHFPEDYFKPFSPQTANTSVPSSLPAGGLASYFSDKIKAIRRELVQAVPSHLPTTCICAPLSCIRSFSLFTGSLAHKQVTMLSFLPLKKTRSFCPFVASQPPLSPFSALFYSSRTLQKHFQLVFTVSNFFFSTLD